MSTPPSKHAGNRKKMRQIDVDSAMAALTINRAKSLAIPLSSNAPADPNSEATCGDEGPSLSEHRRARLLSLPPEILSQIATELCGNIAICNLLLVNKHVHGIVQKAMAKRLVIPPNRIKGALQWLARYPDIISSVNTVDLGAYQSIHRQECICLDDNLDPEATRILRAAILCSSCGVTTWDKLRQLKQLPRQIWSRNHRFFVDLLVSLCPNINNISFQMPAPPSFDRMPEPGLINAPSINEPLLNRMCVPVAPFQCATLQIMQNNLEFLTISPNHRWAGLAQLDILEGSLAAKFMVNGKRLITLMGFKKLKYLDIPMDALGLPPTIVFQDANEIQMTRVDLCIGGLNGQPATTITQVPTKVLPLSLQTLRLRSCDWRLFLILQRVSEIPMHQLQLKRIDMYSDTCARSTLIRCLGTGFGPNDFLRILSEVEQMGIEVTFYTGKHEHPIDMRWELAPVQYLSHCDMAMVALAQKQFSDLNLQAVKRRHRSSLDRLLFHKHAFAHFDLLNSPTFDGKTWIGVAFFHGIKSTRFDTTLLPHNAAIQVEEREDVMPWRRSRGPLDLIEFVFGFLSSKPLPRASPKQQEVVFQGNTFTMASKVLFRNSDCKALPGKRVKGPRIYFEGRAKEGGMSDENFDFGLWCKDDWKYYFQPHVVGRKDF
jgi:hypothetical protein